MKKIYHPKAFSEQRFKPTASSPTGSAFQADPLPTPIQDGALASCELFSYEKYLTPSSLPLECFTLPEDLLAQPLPRCLDMPLRLAGEETYHLPSDWAVLETAVRQTVAFEHAHNPSWRDYHCYLTVDSGCVTVGEQQRHGGLHVDGFQGERIEEKTLVNRSYVATSNGGTRFYQQPFVVVDPREWNVFQGFDLQADEPTFVAGENTVYLMDAYTVHESGLARFDGLRTFFRVSFDAKIFDRWGNTHNSMIPYEWEMVTRNAHELVKSPTVVQVWESPHGGLS